MRNMLTCIMIFLHFHPSRPISPSQQGGKENFNHGAQHTRNCSTTMTEGERGDVSPNSQARGNSGPREVHFIICGDISGCHNEDWWCKRPLAGRDQECCEASYSTQDRLPQQRIIRLKMPLACRLRSPILEG